MMNLKNKLPQVREAADTRFDDAWLNPQHLRRGAGNGNKPAPENLVSIPILASPKKLIYFGTNGLACGNLTSSQLKLP